MRLPDLWRSLYRVVVGVFWLYFASQKWGGVDWMKGLIQGAAAVNPIPGLHEFLAVVVAPNWYPAAVGQGMETLVGVLLVLGLATRKAAVLASCSRSTSAWSWPGSRPTPATAGFTTWRCSSTPS